MCHFPELSITILGAVHGRPENTRPQLSEILIQLVRLGAKLEDNSHLNKLIACWKFILLVFSGVISQNQENHRGQRVKVQRGPPFRSAGVN